MFKYENQGGKAYLVYQLEPGDIISGMTLNMLQNNTISGLAAVSYYQIDAAGFVRFEVTSKVPAAEFFAGRQVKKLHLLNYLESLTGGMKEAEDYMIDLRSLCLEQEHIFVDVDNGETSLICLPLDKSREPFISFQAYFKEFMYGCMFDTGEDAAYVVKINNYLNGADFSLEGFRELLHRLKGSPAPTPPVKPVYRDPAPSSIPSHKQQVSVTPSGGAGSGFDIPKGHGSGAPAGGGNVVIPGGGRAAAAEPKASQKTEIDRETEGSQEAMSLMYLLRHYSKENAEAYKQQKAAAKGGQKAAPASSPKRKQTPPPSGAGFAIPGQESGAFRTPAPRPAAPANNRKPVPPAGISKPAYPQTPSQRPAYPKAPSQEAAAFDGGTVLLQNDQDEGTVILEETAVKQERPSRLVLVQKKSGARVSVNKEDFRIGRNANYCDYCLPDNRAVSSFHAKIITREGRFFIVDANSKNHSYVNGELLPGMAERELKAGDSVCLANEEFSVEIL